MTPLSATPRSHTQTDSDYRLFGAVLVVSDLHLGSPNCNTDGITATLEAADFETLIINGDTYDNLNLHRLRRPHRDVLSRIWELSRREQRVVWIQGNHDAEILPLFNEGLTEYVIDTPHGKVCITHGHQFDHFIRKYPMATSVASYLYYFVQRLVRSNRFSEYIKYKSKSWLSVIDRVRARAVEYAAKQGYAFIVCGHVHHAEVSRHGDVTYVNTGSFMDTAQEGVLLTWDLESLSITLAPCTSQEGRQPLPVAEPAGPRRRQPALAGDRPWAPSSSPLPST